MGYIKSLQLVNFQSHKDTHISFDEGLTVILGPTDQGKSAIIRALKWVLYNEPRGSDFITVGCKNCKVTLEMNDGTVIIREREGNKNRYILKKDGQEQIFEGFGNNVPLEIIKAHGIPKIRIDRDSAATVNLAEQLEAPFLISESGSTRAKALGQLVGVHIIDAAQRKAIKDLVDLEQRKRMLNNEIADLNEDLKNYEDLPAIKERIESLKAIINDLKEKKAILSKIFEIKQKLRPTEQGIDEALKVLDRTEYVKQVERIYLEMSNLNDKLTRLKTLKNNLQETERQIAHIRSVLKSTENLSYCDKIAQKLNEIIFKAKTYESFLHKITLLDDQIKVQKRKLEDYKKVEAIENDMSNIVKKNLKLSSLKNICEKIKTVEASLNKGRTYLKQVMENLNAMTGQYAYLLKKLSKCPTCFSPIDEKTTARIVKEMIDS